MKVHNKLVRDRIPEIIGSSGKRAATHILSIEEYIEALEIKLSEEVDEYLADKSLEEMADIMEVLQAICIARGYNLKQLEEKRREKAVLYQLINSIKNTLNYSFTEWFFLFRCGKISIN